MQIQAETSVLKRPSFDATPCDPIMAVLRTLGAMTAIAALVLSVGCDNGSAGMEPDPMEPDPMEPDPMEPDPMEPGLLALTQQFRLPNGLFNLVKTAPVPRLEDEIDAEGGIEVVGGASIYGYDNSGFVWVGQSQEPTIQRYAVEEDGSLSVDGPRVSFAGLGLSRANFGRGRVPFLSPTKAYLMTNTPDEVVIWNPQEMTIEGTIDLELPEREGFRLVNSKAQVVGNRLYVAFGYLDAANARVAEVMGLAVVDTDTDQVVSITETERCGRPNTSVVSDDGFVYYASGGFTLWANRVFGESNAPDPCILRVRAGETEFDPDFFVSIEDLTGGAGGLSIAGSGGDLFVRVFDDEEYGLPITEQTTGPDIAGAPAFKWWRVTPDFTSATELEEAPFGAASVGTFVIDGRLIIADLTEDLASTNFLELIDGPEGNVRRLGSSQGAVFNLFRVL